MMHQIIFGNGVDETFPHQVVIPLMHESHWNYMDSSYMNDHRDSFDMNFVELGNFLRKYMTGDVFLTQKKVEYNFSAREENGWRETFHDQYYKRDEKDNLIRLPVNCSISFLTIQFREAIDKSQFLLLNSDEFTMIDQIDIDYNIKTSRNSWRDEGHDIMCPLCKVHYDETKHKENETCGD